MGGYAYAAKVAVTAPPTDPTDWPPGWPVPDSDDDPWPPGWPIAESDYSFNLAVPPTVYPSMAASVVARMIDSNGQDASSLNNHVFRLNAIKYGEDLVQEDIDIKLSGGEFASYLYSKVRNYTGTRYGFSSEMFFDISEEDEGKFVLLRIILLSVTPAGGGLDYATVGAIPDPEILDCFIGNAEAEGALAGLSRTLHCSRGDATASGADFSHSHSPAFIDVVFTSRKKFERISATYPIASGWSGAAYFVGDIGQSKNVGFVEYGAGRLGVSFTVPAISGITGAEIQMYQSESWDNSVTDCISIYQCSSYYPVITAAAMSDLGTLLASGIQMRSGGAKVAYPQASWSCSWTSGQQVSLVFLSEADLAQSPAPVSGRDEAVFLYQSPVTSSIRLKFLT